MTILYNANYPLAILPHTCSNLLAIAGRGRQQSHQHWACLVLIPCCRQLYLEVGRSNKTERRNTASRPRRTLLPPLKLRIALFLLAGSLRVMTESPSTVSLTLHVVCQLFFRTVSPYPSPNSIHGDLF